MDEISKQTGRDLTYLMVEILNNDTMDNNSKRIIKNLWERYPYI